MIDALPVLRDVLAPAMVLRGTYEIVRRVGAGGMGVVYEAKHQRLPGRFAVKVLAGKGVPQPAELARFRREVEIAASLRHPNIVQVIDFDETAEGIPFLVMEFLEGRDLGQEIATRGSLPLPRTAAIVEQIASALAAAHGRGVIHRDLKPQNVLLVPLPGRDDDLVKVVDFGISKIVADDTVTGEAMVGTPRYMAPEQARGRGREIDGRTDQFALGAMVYEMLTGVSAFGADDVPATLHKIVNEDPPKLTARLPKHGAALDRVLGRALAKEREGRFLTVLELAGALSEVAAGGAGAPSRGVAGALTVRRAEGGADSPAVRWRPSPRRSLVGAVILGIAALGIAAALSRSRSTPPSRSVEIAPAPPVPARVPAAAAAMPAPQVENVVDFAAAPPASAERPPRPRKLPRSSPPPRQPESAPIAEPPPLAPRKIGFIKKL